VPGQIAIEYEGREAGPEARYIEAWLASSLPDTRVGLKGSGGEGSGRPAVIRVDNNLTVRLSQCAAEYDIGDLHQRASMSGCTEEQLLNTELAIVVHDRVFEAALNRITA
jgi:hypothetical protein